MIPDALDTRRPHGERWLDSEPECYWLSLTPQQAQAMADGYMPHGVRSVLRELLDSDLGGLEDQRRAARPVARAK